MAETEKSLESILDDIKEKGKKQRLYTVLFTLLMIAFGIIWVFVAYNKVNELDAKAKIKMKTLDSLDAVIKKSSLRIASLKQYSPIFDNSFSADSVYKVLLNTGKVDETLAIEYFNKTLDQNNVSELLKTLGYKDIAVLPTRIPHLRQKTTNALYVFNNVKLFDLKLIALTLLRYGCTINTIELNPHSQGHTRPTYNLVQIGSKAFGDDDPTHFKDPPLTVEKIQKATSINDLLLNDK